MARHIVEARSMGRDLLKFLLLTLPGWLLKMLGRFVAGLPMDGERRTDATLWTRGTRTITKTPGWFGGEATGWSYLPGWQRALVRITITTALVGMQWWPEVSIPVVVGICLAAGTFRGYQWWERRRDAEHIRTLVQPAYETLAQYLGTDPEDPPTKWLSVPKTWGQGNEEEEDAEIRLAFPPRFDANERVQKAVDGVIQRYLGSDLKSSWSAIEAKWRRPATLPKKAAFDGYDNPGEIIHVANLAGGKKYEIDMDGEVPNCFVGAEPGAGKTTLLAMFAAHQRAKGFLVDIIDLKRRSFRDMFLSPSVPGIRVHTDAESASWAMEEFFLSQMGVNMAIENGANPDDFPQRTLIIDEFGTMMKFVKNYWKRLKAAGEVVGDPPTMEQFTITGYQGRMARHRMVIGVHQPNLRVFPDSDSRGLFSFRVLLGAFNNSLWRMTFGYVKALKWNSNIKGRGVVGRGEVEEQIHLAQIAFMEPEEQRRYAMTGPKVPQWYTELKSAPWITKSVISEGAKIAGAHLVSPSGLEWDSPANTDANVPGTVPVPTQRDTEPQVSQEIGESTNEEFEKIVSKEFSRGHLRLVTGTELIVGLQSAADFLGMSKETFRKARQRAKKNDDPIPTERITDDGVPVWEPAGLRSWHSKRPRAGARDLDDVSNDE